MWIDELSDRDRVRVSYRYLEHLMIVYFGEDWFDEYESDEAASIADYIRRTEEVDRRETLNELDRMRDESESPEQFERDFRYLSWAYGPPGGATRYRDFADRLADRIRASLD
jgi:hypothetical protein